MGVHIRSLRTKRQLSAVELARILGITPSQLSQYERGWQQPPATVVRDLAVLFECGVTDVLGEEIPVEDWQKSPYASGGLDTEENMEPYGDFGFLIGTEQFTFPVSTLERARLLRWLSERQPGRLDDSEEHEWLRCSTLNNRILFINPRRIRRAWLRSDDEEAISYFAHPEVYRAVDDQMYEGEVEWGPVLAAQVRAHKEHVGAEAAETEVAQLKVYGPDGHPFGDEWYLSNDAALTSLMALDMNGFRIEPGTMLLTSIEGYYVAEFVRLSEVGFIEAPSERYHRLGAPEERAANDTTDGDDELDELLAD